MFILSKTCKQTSMCKIAAVSLPILHVRTALSFPRFGTELSCVLWPIASCYYCAVLREVRLPDRSRRCLVGLEITWWRPARTRRGHFVFCAVRHSESLLMTTRCQKQTLVLWLQTEPPISCVWECVTCFNWISENCTFCLCVDVTYLL